MCWRIGNDRRTWRGYVRAICLLFELREPLPLALKQHALILHHHQTRRPAKIFPDAADVPPMASHRNSPSQAPLNDSQQITEAVALVWKASKPDN